jgi:hypothetical protein
MDPPLITINREVPPHFQDTQEEDKEFHNIISSRINSLVWELEWVELVLGFPI